MSDNVASLDFAEDFDVNDDDDDENSKSKVIFSVPIDNFCIKLSRKSEIISRHYIMVLGRFLIFFTSIAVMAYEVLNDMYAIF